MPKRRNQPRAKTSGRFVKTPSRRQTAPASRPQTKSAASRKTVSKRTP